MLRQNGVGTSLTGAIDDVMMVSYLMSSTAKQPEATMHTLAAHRSTIDTATETEPIRTTTEEVEIFDDCVPASRGAPRQSRRIAMQARDMQDRYLTRW
jgi:hypothetical protein